ncbi:MAG: hypothetical protein LAT68_14090 [Cyclobacteriaceae bacterium]|nr:hypothetical protein [Cyclobacteriaceae bacterium]MCH8517451.1 hypothetical protein [Cyclobacteriaceae bacterium]
MKKYLFAFLSLFISIQFSKAAENKVFIISYHDISLGTSSKAPAVRISDNELISPSDVLNAEGNLSFIFEDRSYEVEARVVGIESAAGLVKLRVDELPADLPKVTFSDIVSENRMEVIGIDENEGLRSESQYFSYFNDHTLLGQTFFASVNTAKVPEFIFLNGALRGYRRVGMDMVLSSDLLFWETRLSVDNDLLPQPELFNRLQDQRNAWKFICFSADQADNQMLLKHSPGKLLNPVSIYVSAMAELSTYDYKDALRYFDYLGRENVLQYNLLFYRAVVNEKLGNAAQVKSDLSELSRRIPDFETNIILRAHRYDKLSKTSQALTVLSHLLALRPDNLDAILLAAGLEKKLDNYRSVLNLSNEALAIEPRNSMGLFYRGVARTRSGDDDGVEDIEQAIEIDIENIEAIYFLVEYYRDRKDLENLLKYTEKYLDIDPSHEEVRFQRAYVAYEYADLSAARSDLEYLYAKGSKNAKVHEYLGHVYFQMGYLDEAKVSYTVALELDKRLHDAYKNKGLIEMQQGEIAYAMRDFMSMAAYFPNSAEAHLLKAISKIRLKTYNSAYDDLRKAIALDGNYAEAYYYLGVLKNATKEYYNAINHLETAIMLDKHNYRSYHQVGIAYHGLNDRQSCDYWEKAASYGIKESVLYLEEYCGR